MKPREFVDSVKVYVAGGRGGDGCCSFRREKYVPKGGPDGGDGGRGGDVVLEADPHTSCLVSLHYSPHLRAPNGGHGKGKQMNGRHGADLLARVPCGTEVWDFDRQELLGDLLASGARLVVARGGKGGLGNPHWKTSTHQAPYEHTPGAEGDVRTLRLELKLVADFGLVGFPNAGKSSLLRCLTNAQPKVAAYPFTTLHPIIGALPGNDYTTVTIADIPGLLEGAHRGIGLGDRFLRHIERSAALLFVLDMAGTEGRNPSDDFETLRHELAQYRRELLRRPALVVANKMDLPEAPRHLRAFRRRVRRNLFAVSAVTGEGIPELRAALLQRERWTASPGTKAGVFP